jgi:hypothetical protein
LCSNNIIIILIPGEEYRLITPLEEAVAILEGDTERAVVLREPESWKAEISVLVFKS